MIWVLLNVQQEEVDKRWELKTFRTVSGTTQNVREEVFPRTMYARVSVGWLGEQQTAEPIYEKKKCIYIFLNWKHILVAEIERK